LFQRIITDSDEEAREAYVVARARRRGGHLKARYFIQGSRTERPSSSQTIFCDGSADETFRPGIDLELSHWVPNRTPASFKADTSTEICLRFAETPLPGAWSLAVNNHLDVDGVLSVFAICEPDLALRNRRVLVGAAEMGDFWAWADAPSQELYQGLALLQSRARDERTDIQLTYERCFDYVRSFLGGDGRPDPELEEGLSILREGVEWIESGRIRRSVAHDRFVTTVVPREVVGERLVEALCVAPFNVPFSVACLVWPHARARWDKERVQLVCTEGVDGFFYDLHYPGYVWAETPHSWRPPGVLPTTSSNAYTLAYPAVDSAADRLNELEGGDGRWTLAKTLGPFGTLEGRGFPVVLSVLDDHGRQVSSRLPPERVGEILSPVWRSDHLVSPTAAR
jgi:hypothetical protein